jgi:hypothetical protein
MAIGVRAIGTNACDSLGYCRLNDNVVDALLALVSLGSMTSGSSTVSWQDPAYSYIFSTSIHLLRYCPLSTGAASRKDTCTARLIFEICVLGLSSAFWRQSRIRQMYARHSLTTCSAIRADTTQCNLSHKGNSIATTTRHSTNPR